MVVTTHITISHSSESSHLLHVLGAQHSLQMTASTQPHCLRYATSTSQSCYILQWVGTHFPQKCHFPWRDVHPCNTWFLEPCKSILQWHLNRLSHFAGLVVNRQINKQTQRQTMLLCLYQQPMLLHVILANYIIEYL